MNEFLKMCLILAPLLFLTGFVDSVAGGGGLISLPAYLLVGLPVHLAFGTNKVINGIGTGFAAVRYAKGGKIRFRTAIWAGCGALPGAFLGARLAMLCSDRVLKTCLLIALPAVAAVLFLKPDFGKREQPARNLSLRRESVYSFLIGLGIGVYDGLIGPGTGTFMLMAFTLVLGMDLLTASGCAKVANLASNIASAAVWIMGGQVLWKLVLPATCCCVLGNWCGARYAIRGGSSKVRGMIFVVLALLFVKLIYEMFLK